VTIKEVMNSPSRKIYGKVEITYTEPFKDESISLSSNQVGRGTDPEELADAKVSPPYKWFSLHDSKLDGTYHPMPSKKQYSIGLWGTSLSDAQGVLGSPLEVTIQFAPRAVISLQLPGDDKLNSFPVDFTFRLYDSEGTLLYTHPVTGNTNVRWMESIVPVLNVSKITVTVTKINKPNQVAKLTELFTAIVETYLDDNIGSIHSLEEIGYEMQGLPIGNLSSNEVDIVLSNEDRRFDLQNTNSVLYGYIRRNRRVDVWLGAEVDGVMEWYSLGKYWTTQWDISHETMSVAVTARDRLEILRYSDFTTSKVYQNYSLYQLFELVLQDAGLSSDEYVIDEELKDMTVKYAWFDKVSHRQALAQLAGCGIIHVYCMRDGRIRVSNGFDATSQVQQVFDDDVNVVSTRYPVAVSEQINYVEVTSKEWGVAATTKVFETDESFVVPGNSSVTQTFEFTRKPMFSISTPTVTASGALTVTYSLYAWGVDVTFSNTQATAVTVTSVVINGQPLEVIGSRVLVAKDDDLIREDGKIRVPIDHDFIQSTTYAQQLANEVLNTYKQSTYDIALENRGDISLNLADRVLVRDSRTNTEREYIVTRQTLSWAGYLEATTEGKLL